MPRYKNENHNRFRMTPCQKCGEQVSDRKSEAIHPEEKDAGQYILAKSKDGTIITRKAFPRRHRAGEGCRK